jgi:hypothetical protein
MGVLLCGSSAATGLALSAGLAVVLHDLAIVHVVAEHVKHDLLLRAERVRRELKIGVAQPALEIEQEHPAAIRRPIAHIPDWD